jgi:hypothetical protein
MAVQSFNLPVCDVCGEPWLPQKGPAREDIRKWDAEQRAVGKKVRCGKCKSEHWDRDFVFEAHPVQEVIMPDLSMVELTYIVDNPRNHPGRCRHRELNCSICHPKPAA